MTFYWYDKAVASEIEIMAIFREFIAPLLILLVFLVALVAVTARIWLPQEMMGPAPIEESVEDLSFVPTPLSLVPGNI